MMIKTRNIKGITIVELLIYISLLAIFMIVLLDVFVVILNAKLESESTSALNQDSRYILAKLSYDVANASTFSIPNSSTLILGTKTYTLDGGNLTLNSARLNGLDTKIDGISFVKVGNTVKTTFTIESLVILPGGARTQTVQTTLGIRP